MRGEIWVFNASILDSVKFGAAAMRASPVVGIAAMLLNPETTPAHFQMTLPWDREQERPVRNVK